MSDNTPKPRNYKRGRCLAIESAKQLVAELIEEFDGSESSFIIGPRTQDAIRIVLQSREFYAQRCETLQRVQTTFRDPERQIVCEILACGYSKAVEAERAPPMSDGQQEAVYRQFTEGPKPIRDNLMERPLEYCFACGEPTGKAGKGDGSIYCNCGAGPLCDECWEMHNCPHKEAEERGSDEW